MVDAIINRFLETLAIAGILYGIVFFMLAIAGTDFTAAFLSAIWRIIG